MEIVYIIGISSLVLAVIIASLAMLLKLQRGNYICTCDGDWRQETDIGVEGTIYRITRVQLRLAGSEDMLFVSDIYGKER